MAHEVISPAEGHHAYIDRALLQKLKEAVRRHWRPTMGGTLEATQSQIIGHSYIRVDEWQAAADRERRERWKRAEKTLIGFKERLARHEIEIRGITGTTGQAAITAEKLEGRSVPHLDVAPDFLLIQLERHPRGSEIVQDHYWLYSSKQRWAELLRPIQDVYKGKFNDLYTMDRSGHWKPLVGSKGEFYQIVESKLGPAALQDFKRLTTFQLLPIATPPHEILQQCQQRTGHDHLANEKLSKLAAEARYLKKYGPRKVESAGFELHGNKGFQLHVLTMDDQFKQVKQDVSAYLARINEQGQLTEQVRFTIDEKFSIAINFPGAGQVQISLRDNQLLFQWNNATEQSFELQPRRQNDESGKYLPYFAAGNNLISSQELVELIFRDVNGANGGKSSQTHKDSSGCAASTSPVSGVSSSH